MMGLLYEVTQVTRTPLRMLPAYHVTLVPLRKVGKWSQCLSSRNPRSDFIAQSVPVCKQPPTNVALRGADAASRQSQHLTEDKAPCHNQSMYESPLKLD